MKRYRVGTYDFDSRPTFLATRIEDHWDERLKASWQDNKAAIRQGLQEQFGSWEFETKLQNLADIGPKPMSILAFHNEFAEQVRRAFIVGAYYPALVGACALGERLLNHLVLLLRDDFRTSPEYKRVYRKSSFDNWQVPIATLSNWSVLLPETETAFESLSTIRNRTVHFEPQTDTNDRSLALEAVRLLTSIIELQFSSFGRQPWFIPDTRGVAFLSKAAESQPFIRRVYIPNSVLVGPWHTVARLGDDRLVVEDRYPYDDREVSDEEFRELFHAGPTEDQLRARRP